MPEIVHRHRAWNLLLSALILLAMGVVLAGVGALLGGAGGAALAVLSAALFAALLPAPSVQRLLRAHGARTLRAGEVPGLHAAVGELARRAGLDAAPALHLVPLPVPQAMATESRGQQAIAISPALLRGLPPAEVVAVLAHEISHLAHGDLGILRLAETVHRTTRAISTFGLVLALLNFPLWLVGGTPLPWLGLALLVAAPWAVGLLAAALSRAREHDADAGAVLLLGESESLASALARIEAATRAPLWLQRLLLDVPASLRTHPPTEERLARLSGMTGGRRARARREARARPDGARVVEPIWLRRSEVRPALRARRIVVG